MNGGIFSDFFKLESFQVHMFHQVVNNTKGHGELYITNITEIRGADTIGKYHESITNWHSPNWPSPTTRQPYFQTSIKLYFQQQDEEDEDEGDSAHHHI